MVGPGCPYTSCSTHSFIRLHLLRGKDRLGLRAIWSRFKTINSLLTDILEFRSLNNLRFTVLAEMLDDEAPEVCRIVWDLLPVENKTIHGQFSGAEVFILLENPQPIPKPMSAAAKMPAAGARIASRSPTSTSDRPPTR